MTPDEYQKKVETDIVKNFLKTFYEKVGYYPIVIINEKSGVDESKTISLLELETYFEPYLPIIYGKKQKLGSKSRSRPLPELRFIFCHIARAMRYSLKQIGQHLGGRDHTTVIHGLTTFNNLYQTDDRFKELYHKIINNIKNKYESSVMDYIDKAQDKSQSNIFFGLLQRENTTQ